MATFEELERKYKLPAGILGSVMRAESGGNPNAVSPAGAQGLFQFMPATAQQYGIDPFNPDQAAPAAAQMLGELQQKYGGDLPSTLAGYNWGQGNVDRKGLANMPTETRDYIARVTSGTGGGDMSAELFGDSPQEAGRDMSAELFGDSPQEAGRDMSAELFGEEPPSVHALPGEKVSFGAPFRQQVHQGIMETFRGGKQLAMKAGAALGMVDPKEAEDYRRQVAEEQLLYQAHNPNFQPGRLLGNIAAVPLPQAATATLGRTALTGAALGVLQPATGQDFAREKLSQAAVGAIAGPAMQFAGRGIATVAGKALGRAQGQLTPGVAKLLYLSEKYGVPLSYSDITKSQFAKRAEDVLEYTLGFGVVGNRKAQREAAQAATVDAASTLKDKMLNVPWQGLKQVEKAAASGDKRAINLLSEIEKSGDDWNRIIQTSGNLNFFRKKLISDRFYGEVSRQAAGLGEVPMDRTNEQLAQNLARIEKDILPDTELAQTFARVQERLQSPDVDLTFEGVRRLRSDLGDLIDGYYQGKNAMTGSKGVDMLVTLQKSIDQDMQDFATNSGSKHLAESWKRADSFYQRNIAGYKETAVAKALKDSPPDEVFGKFMKSGLKDRAEDFYRALDPKGQAAVRYGMVSRALNESIDSASQRFDPGKFAGEMEKLSEARGVVFKGAGKGEIDGFVKLMRHSEASARQTIPVMSAQQLMGVGLSAAMSMFSIPLTAAAGGVAGVARLLLVTDAGRRFLLAANMLKPGSSAMADLVNRMNVELTKTAATQAGAEKGQPGRVLP